MLDFLKEVDTKELGIKLKPCSHCGGKAILWEVSGDIYQIQCACCSIGTLPNSLNYLETIWNRRVKLKVNKKKGTNKW